MIGLTYPASREDANHILDLVRAGFHVSEHLVRYCLLLTGDLT